MIFLGDGNSEEETEKWMLLEFHILHKKAAKSW